MCSDRLLSAIGVKPSEEIIKWRRWLRSRHISAHVQDGRGSGSNIHFDTLEDDGARLSGVG